MQIDLSGKTALDIGCNAGFYSIEMARRGADRVVGVDFDERYLRQAKLAAEFFGVDIWMRADEMMSFYEDPEFLEGFNHMFTAEANTGVWTHPKGDWTEW